MRDGDAVDLLGGRGDALLEVGAEQALLLLRPFTAAAAAVVDVVVVVEAVLERVSGQQRQGGRSAVPAYTASCSYMAIVGIGYGTNFVINFQPPVMTKKVLYGPLEFSVISKPILGERRGVLIGLY